MEKETPELNPGRTTGGNPVAFQPTPKNDSVSEVDLVAKEKREQYYIDPLEQDAIMAKKLQQADPNAAVKSETKVNATTSATSSQGSDIIRPDISVNGMFSAGQTKSGFHPSANVVVLALTLIGIVLIPILVSIISTMFAF